MTRDILNYLGEVIGTLELSDDTPEHVWEEKLAMYAAPPPTPVIEPVTSRQIRLAMFLQEGLTEETVDAALATLPEPTRTLAQIEWKHASYLERDKPFVTMVGEFLGWTSGQVDELWLYAATL